MKNLVLIFLITCFTAFSQNDKELAKKALEILQKKDFDKAIMLFDSAFTISGNYDYLYEKALVHYKRKEFKLTAEIIEDILDNSKPKELHYQLLGSAYDFQGDKQKALNVLRAGLLKFPNSARLQYELGITEFGQSNLKAAVTYWDNAINADPYFANTYFQLMKETYNNDRKIYALLFAEIFLNLPAEDEKKKEASSLIYNTYSKSIESNESETQTDFTEYVGDYDTEDAANYPFRIAFQQIADKVYKPSLTVGFDEIYKFRKDFLEMWFEQGFNELFPNPVFEYQKQLLDEGLFEAYSYMLMSSGDLENFKIFVKSNSGKFQEFFNWQIQNPIDLETFKFNTSVYMQD
jgi:hypothetical protein